MLHYLTDTTAKKHLYQTKLKKMMGTYLAPGKKSEIKTLGAPQPQAEKEKLRKLQQLEPCEFQVREDPT